MYTGMSKNEYGTPISKHKCDTCGGEYTVCPPVPENSQAHISLNCNSEHCQSYDPAYDADILFMTDAEIAEKKPQVCIDMLRMRKEGKIVSEPIKGESNDKR